MDLEIFECSHCAEFSKYRSEVCTSQRRNGHRLEFERSTVRSTPEHNKKSAGRGRLQQRPEKPDAFASLQGDDTVSECATYDRSRSVDVALEARDLPRAVAASARQASPQYRAAGGKAEGGHFNRP